jgi:NAD(P)-dependent dehydrogenase (short-subunit alcohol dehydrogenase family)
VDLQHEKSVRDAVAATLAHFGTLDVVVNNAGYGQFGTLEELSDAEARQNFDVNVFGALHTIRHVMPHFRENRSGHLFNISSVGGFSGGFPNAGIYCATKFALAGLTEALAAEGKPFGIRATIVYPGYFRTSFLAEDSIRLPQHPIAAYEEARASERRHLEEINGRQPGDPEKAADALIRMAREPEPPLHLFLGQDAYELAVQKMGSVEAELKRWQRLTVSTAFAEQPA